MVTLRNSFIFLFGIFFTYSATANELFKFNREVAGFVDYNSPQSMMFISQDGRADWLNSSLKVTKKVFYTITNPMCIPYNQNTMTMDGEHAGMTLAYPFLVGVGWACVIDETKNSIDLISEFALPVNVFSIVYAGQDQLNSYFLMNSKPTKGEGFLHLVAINKLTLAISTKEFATNVPGYSGAMLFDAGDIWVTSWPGKIYKISNQKLMNFLESGIKPSFLQMAQVEFSGIDGMSLFMLRNDKSFLYYNDEYESYTVNLSSKKTHDVTLACLPVSAYGQNWLTLCDGTSLQQWSE